MILPVWADLWATGAAHLAGVLPERASFGYGRALARALPHLFSARRRLALVNLREAGFSHPEAVYEEMIDHLARDFTLFFRLPRHRRQLERRWFRVENRPPEKAFVAAFVHYSGWELGLTLGAGHFPGALAAAQRLPYPRLEQTVARCRAAAGGRVLVLGGSVRPLHETLRAGAPVSVLADLRPPAGRGIAARFLGQPARIDDRAERLAARAGVPLYMGWTRFEDGCYRLRFAPVSGSLEVMQRLEALLRRDPAPWIWMHNRWGRAAW